jgi:hypothetical protein
VALICRELQIQNLAVKLLCKFLPLIASLIKLRKLQQDLNAQLMLHSCVAALGLWRYLLTVAECRKEFWQKHPGIVWSNPDADDAVRIRRALLRPKFDRLLDIALEFGIERLRCEWWILEQEDTPEARRAQSIVKRILANIQQGFSSVTAGN